MNVNKLVKWSHDAAERSYGESCAYNKCSEEIKDMLQADLAEVRIILESMPEPSNSERVTWHPATKQYVELLESIVDNYINDLKTI